MLAFLLFKVVLTYDCSLSKDNMKLLCCLIVVYGYSFMFCFFFQFFHGVGVGGGRILNFGDLLFASLRMKPFLQGLRYYFALRKGSLLVTHSYREIRKRVTGKQCRPRSDTT